MVCVVSGLVVELCECLWNGRECSRCAYMLMCLCQEV